MSIDMSIEWSTEKPEFELGSHDAHGEVDDIYGETHNLSFVSGEVAEPESFHVAIVQMGIGGSGRKTASGKIIAQFKAFYGFPIHRETSLEGLFVTHTTPEPDEIEVMASGLVQVLASREPANMGDAHFARS